MRCLASYGTMWTATAATNSALLDRFQLAHAYFQRVLMTHEHPESTPISIHEPKADLLPNAEDRWHTDRAPVAVSLQQRPRMMHADWSRVAFAVASMRNGKYNNSKSDTLIQSRVLILVQSRVRLSVPFSLVACHCFSSLQSYTPAHWGPILPVTMNVLLAQSLPPGNVAPFAEHAELWPRLAV